jgi:hypothetical protein
VSGSKSSGRLREHLRTAIVHGLEGLTREDKDDVYVISLLVQDNNDDPRRPTVTVGYNTERRAKECTPSPGQRAKWPIASNAGEARWNYAFWLQDALAVACDPDVDPRGAHLVEEWARGLGYWYTDDEAKRDFDATLRKDAQLTPAFVELLVAVVADLQCAGEVARYVGRQVPILIHELEYYEEIADQNARANPPELVRDFVSWVLSS